MCNICINETKIKTKTTFTVDYKDCIIVIKNAPCLECEIFGEIAFTDGVSEKIELFGQLSKKSNVGSFCY